VVLALAVCVMATKQAAEGTSQNFTITCDNHDSENCQSPSLEEIANEIVMGQHYLDLMIDIQVVEIYLNTTMSFSNLSSLMIRGGPEMTTIICKSDSTDAGFVLTDILNKVSLKNLNFTYCGSLFKNVFKDNKMFISALTLVHCSNIEIDSLALERSRGLGMTILNHQGGRVNVNSSLFKENQLPRVQNLMITGRRFGGGGMYILLGQFLPGPHVYLPMTFQFVNCTFLGNVAHTQQYNILFTDVMGNPQEGYGRGGGVHVSIKNSIDHIHISFNGCQFIANQAFIGGGLSVKMHGETKETTQEMRNITVAVINSTFEHNGCRRPNHTYFGGGIHLSFHTILDHSAIRDGHYLVRNVSFIGNCAELGGGAVYSFDHGFIITNNSVLFDNCTFERNTAHIGSAVDITPNIFLKVLNGFMVVPIFANCRFLNNFVTVNGSQSVQVTAGVGTIYASRSEIRFQGNNHFVSNRGSAVYMVNGIVNFQDSDAIFTSNSGLHGGAVALIGSATIIIGSNNYEFINNTASYQGGAVYAYLIDSTDFITSRSCFIQYKSENNAFSTNNKWNANVTFVGNRAKDNSSGHAIYATSLHPCQVTINGTLSRHNYTLTNISEVFKIQGVRFDNNQTLQPQISTDGAQLHQSKPSPHLIIPGEKYKHGVTITDDFDVTIATLFRASITRSTMNIELDPSLSSFVGDTVQLSGAPDQTASLSLQTVSPRQSYIRLEVKLLQCPPGFRLNNNSQCVCNVESYVGLFKCDLENFNSHLLPGFWAGLLLMDNETELVTSPCPFCNYSSSASNATEFEVILPRDHSELDETVCGGTRTGIVCGACRKGYTVHFHSPGFLCKEAAPLGCRVGWLFYILSELVPATAVFITVLLLNISFTSGAVNGFILFSQLLGTLDIDASGIIPFPKSARDAIRGWTQGYRVIYGFLNLDYFSLEPMSFCLCKGATALDMLAFKYVTILYALLLIITVVWIMNQFGGRCLGKVCRITAIKTSVIHGISTFLVICYAQCIKVSLSLLIPVDIHTEESSSFRPDHRVWLNGNILYFRKEHLRYALPALFCLLTIGLLPPALLLAYPLLNRAITVFGCEDIKIVNYISQKFSFNKFKPVFDSIQGCFKDNFRFFAGLYFLYRWIVLIIYMTTKGFSAYYTAVGGVFLLILTVHTICQPYIKRVHNIIDTLLFANLLLINSLSFFNYYRSRGQRDIEQGGTVLPAIVQLVLIYLPMIVMCMYIVAILCKNVEKCGCKKSLAALPFPEQKNRKLRELIRTISAQDDSDDTNDEEFTHDRHVDDDINYTTRYLNEQETAPFSTYT
jgi:hypothetical protein